MKGKISTSGYRKDSKDRNNDFNIIESPFISMTNVAHPVFGISDAGESKLMLPGQQYKFGGSKVFEIPIKDVDKKAMKDFYPYFMNMGGGYNDKAQMGTEVQTPQNIKTLKKPGDINKSEQNIAAQYNLEGLPSLTERNTWNNYLDWVESKGYKPGSDSLAALNKGTNRFSELSSQYNTESADKLKAEYAKVKANPSFDKNITEQQYIQSRTVNPQMMMNAQKVYGQQTSKDQWFGSETARTFYPKIQGLGVAYENPNDPVVQQKIATASGKLAPVQVFDYKTNKQVPYQGVVPISGYNPKGSPQYDWGKVQPFQPSLASNVYYDPAGLTSGAKALYQPYLPQQQKGGPVDNDFFNDFIKPHFEPESKDTAPQGQDTDTVIHNKKEYFLKCLRENVGKHMLAEGVKEIAGQMNLGGGYKAQMGTQVNLYDPNDPTKIPPINTMMNYYAGPFGNNNVQTPDYVTAEANKYPVFNTDPNQQGTPSNLNLTPGMDANKIAYQKYLQDNQNKAGNAQNLSNIATGVMAGMNVFNNAAEYQQNKNYQNKLRNNMSAENIFSDIKGSRGDYDLNSGAFRPNQMTPAQYKKGGQYSVDENELSRLKSLGYQFDIID